MLRAGGFKDLPPGDVATLVYWKLTGGRKPGEERVIAVSEAEIEDQVERLAALISHYSDPASPYRARPRPAHALRYNDYAHLARIREWAGDEEEGWSP